MPVNEKSLLSLPRQRSIAGIIHRLNEKLWLGSVRLLIVITDVHLCDLLHREDRQRLQIELMKANLPKYSLARCWKWPFCSLWLLNVKKLLTTLRIYCVFVSVSGCFVTYSMWCESVREREREEVLSLWLLLSPLVLIMFFVEWTKEE